jgi:hypothetical protein
MRVPDRDTEKRAPRKVNTRYPVYQGTRFCRSPVEMFNALLYGNPVRVEAIQVSS